VNDLERLLDAVEDEAPEQAVGVMLVRGPTGHAVRVAVGGIVKVRVEGAASRSAAVAAALRVLESDDGSLDLPFQRGAA
jgi:hypothetical protein